MPNIQLKAHFDGRAIQLDEHFPLAAFSRLLVTVLQPKAEYTLHAAWYKCARSGLATAYGDQEPDYDLSDVINT